MANISARGNLVNTPTLRPALRSLFASLSPVMDDRLIPAFTPDLSCATKALANKKLMVNNSIAKLRDFILI